MLDPETGPYPQPELSAACPGDEAAGPLETLVSEIDAALSCRDAGRGSRIARALAAAAVRPGLLRPDQLAPGADSYARHVLHADPAGRYTILSLVWAPGQGSPVHAHRTWCAYAVRSGPLTETLFRFEERTGEAFPLRTAQRHAGYGTYGEAGPEQVHRLVNAGDGLACSIHVYGVDAARICTGVNRVLETA